MLRMGGRALCWGILHNLFLICFLMILNNIGPAITSESCPRGYCRDNRCPRQDYEKCPEEECGAAHKRCPGTLFCVVKSMQSCPGEGCTKYESKCYDGICVLAYQVCPDGTRPCAFYQKRCKDGTCVRKSGRCLEDPCPTNRPVNCGMTCYRERARCDGFNHCSDGSDELNCPEIKEEEKEKTDWKWYLMFLLVLPFGCCCYYCCCKSSKDDKGGGCCDDVDDENQTEMNATRTSGITSAIGGPGESQPFIAPTAVIYNNSGSHDVDYIPSHNVNPQQYPIDPVDPPAPYAPGPTGASAPPYPPAAYTTAPFLTPVVPPPGGGPSASSNPTAPPPSYHEVISSQDTYAPPPEAPPHYCPSSVEKIETVFP